MAKPINNYCLVKVDSFHKDWIALKNGKIIFQDTTYRPLENITQYGELISLTSQLTGIETLYYTEELHKVYPKILSETKTDSILIDLEVGDKVYFQWNAIDTEKMIDGYYLIPYHLIYCGIRNNTIIMNASYVFMKPYFGSGVKDLGDGRKGIFKGDLLIGFATQIKNQGEVCHVGNNLKNEPNELSVGDIVQYQEHFDPILEVEGVKYMATQQFRILAKIN